MASKSTYFPTPSPANALPRTQSKVGKNAADISRLFVNKADSYLTARNGKWFLQRLPLTPERINAALNGRLAVGVQAVSGIGTSRFTCLDVDDELQFQQLLSYVTNQPTSNLLVEQSRRGGHVWFFWFSNTTWQQAHQFGLTVCEAVGIECESYPKHGLDHTIKLPGTRHPKSGVTYPAIDLETGELVPVMQLLPHIHPLECPVAIDETNYREKHGSSNCSEKSNGSPNSEIPNLADFEELVDLLNTVTEVRVYAPQKGIARCIWHHDSSPSLFVKHGRFHCLSSRCEAWGDIHDLRKYINEHVYPPRG